MAKERFSALQKFILSSAVERRRQAPEGASDQAASIARSAILREFYEYKCHRESSRVALSISLRLMKEKGMVKNWSKGDLSVALTEEGIRKGTELQDWLREWREKRRREREMHKD